MYSRIRKIGAFAIVVSGALLAGCASTEFKAWEGKNLVEGQGGTKVMVDGMEFWENGEPPRRFKLLGYVEDERSGGIISMAGLKGDIVKKARKVGGDAVIKIHSKSQINGYQTYGQTQASTFGGTTAAYGSATTIPFKKNFSTFAVIKYVN